MNSHPNVGNPNWDNTAKFPIAEIFTSVHGEGRWAGTRMTFIRLAGCSVGRQYGRLGTAIKEGINQEVLPILPSGKTAYQCTTFDGRVFPCDTDFQKTESLSMLEIYYQIPKGVEHVCITGGEPLMHKNLLDLMNYLQRFWIHIETSGTIEFPKWSSEVYVACSPKAGYLPEMVKLADEVRIMVDDKVGSEPVRELLKFTNLKYQGVFFSPLCIGDTTIPEPSSLKACMDFVEEFPGTKVSIQMHKVLGVR